MQTSKGEQRCDHKNKSKKKKTKMKMKKNHNEQKVFCLNIVEGKITISNPNLLPKCGYTKKVKKYTLVCESMYEA